MFNQDMAIIPEIDNENKCLAHFQRADSGIALPGVTLRSPRAVSLHAFSVLVVCATSWRACYSRFTIHPTPQILPCIIKSDKLNDVSKCCPATGLIRVYGVSLKTDAVYFHTPAMILVFIAGAIFLGVKV